MSDPKRFKFEFTEGEIQLIAAGLGQLKLGESLGVFMSVQRQFNAQNQPPPDPSEAEPPPPEVPKVELPPPNNHAVS